MAKAKTKAFIEAAVCLTITALVLWGFDMFDCNCPEDFCVYGTETWSTASGSPAVRDSITALHHPCEDKWSVVSAIEALAQPPGVP